MKKLFFITLILTLGMVSCQREANPAGGEATVIYVSAQPTKTALGDASGSTRPVYWTNGDCLSLNGTTSEPLSGLAADAATASFSFGSGSFSAPYNLLFPASYWKDATHVTLPDTQTWADGNGVTIPLAGIASAIDGTSTSDLAHLCAILHLRIKKSASVSAANLTSVTFKGNNGEQVCGDFEIDYSSASLTPAGTGAEVALTLNQALSESQALDIFLSVPAQTYSKGFSVVLEDAQSRTMTISTGSSPVTFTQGKIARSPITEFVPGDNSQFTLEDLPIESIGFDGYNVTGRVVDQNGNGLSGVVVSDGLQCVRTMGDGRFYLNSNLSKTKFVWVSTPSGYLPQVEAGIPKYYKLLTSGTLSGGVYDMGDYALNAMANPDHFTILMSADPQPRDHTKWNIDNVAYRSVRAAEDLYRELTETAMGIGGRQVIGICLGDLVHEDMDLLSSYALTLGTLGYPTYNVMGNHDYDTSAADDDAGAVPFENLFGPRNYSFNMGGLHFVVLDNIIMKKVGTNLTMDPDHDKGGLTEEVWAWLQADLALVPTSTKLMVCSHAPMFKADSNAERTGGSHPVQYGPEYGDLIDNYAEIHAWAGHTHSTFNFNYKSSHAHKRVQVHTLARSTGELWTNEYLASGTPRGFTVVNVDNGEVTWKFHPTRYQKAAFQGQGSSYAAPAYTYRDWDYVSNTAVMRVGGGDLTEDYQMHVYAPGVYEAGYAYVNVFLWDDKWQKPAFSLNGGAATEMTPIAYDAVGSYDYATHEFREYYLDKSSQIQSVSSEYPNDTQGLWTIFKVPCDAATGTGTVTVTDRFGNVYSQSISW